MNRYIARVVDGELVLRVPTDLPDGTEVPLVRDEDDLAWMSAAERAELEASIDEGLAEARAGLGRPAREVMAEIREQFGL